MSASRRLTETGITQAMVHWPDPHRLIAWPPRAPQAPVLPPENQRCRDCGVKWVQERGRCRGCARLFRATCPDLDAPRSCAVPALTSAPRPRRTRIIDGVEYEIVND